MIFRAFVFIGLLLVSAPAVAAPAFQVYPVHGFFFPAEGSASLINDQFRHSGAVDGGVYFEQKFREKFPEAAAAIDEANKRRTFAVSLQVARASFYTVPKPPSTLVDVYLPMTASLYFTNVMTGEVLFALTRTDLPLGTITVSELNEPGHIRDLYVRYFHELVDELVADARQQFNPHTTKAVVKAEWHGLAILNAGERAGVAIDDTFDDPQGNELRVVSVGQTYSVAQADLGKFSTGAEFSRVSNQTMAEVHRARVLVFVDESPAELPQEALQQIFSDALGSKTPISLLPVNRTFAEVLKTVATHTEISQEQLKQRELPDFFLRLHVAEPITFEAPTAQSFRKRRITEALAFAEVEDRSGHVLFATWGKDRVQDDVVNNIALSLANRREIVVKNALIELAKKFGSGFQLKRLELPVSGATADGGTVRDDAGALTSGATVRVYHRVGNQGGIDDVQIPIWEGEVDEVTQGSAHFRTLLPIAQGMPAPANGDVIVFEASASSRPARTRLGPCGAGEKLGALDVPGFAPVMMNLFAAGSPAPFYGPGLAAHVSSLVSAGCGFKSDVPLHEPQVDLCVQAAHRIDEKGEKCSDEDCVKDVTMKLLFRVRKGLSGDVVAKHGMETIVHSTALPPNTPPDIRATSLQTDLLDEAMGLAPKMTAAFAGEKL